MRISIVGSGRVFEGTATQIVEAMQYIAFGQEERTLSDYIDWVVDQAQRMNEVALDVTGESEAAKAASLIDAMLEAGMAKRSKG